MGVESEPISFTNTVVFENRNIIRFHGTIIAEMESNVDNMSQEQLNIYKQLPLTNGDYIHYPATSSSNNWVNWYTEVVDSSSASAYVLYYTDSNYTKQYLKFNNENNGSDITETIGDATVLEIKTNSSGYQYFYIPPSEPEPGAVPICFPAGTPVTTDQGFVPIEKLNPDIHTIKGKKIIAITQTRPLFKEIVSIQKNALAKNVPSQDTEISNHHMVSYQDNMIKASELVELCEGVKFIPYNGETLYNVLLKKYSVMIINNMVCETLHPDNIMAYICGGMFNKEEKNILLNTLTGVLKKKDIIAYSKLNSIIIGINQHRKTQNKAK